MGWMLRSAILGKVAPTKRQPALTVFERSREDRAAGTGYLHTIIKHLAVHLTTFWRKLD